MPIAATCQVPTASSPFQRHLRRTLLAGCIGFLVVGCHTASAPVPATQAAASSGAPGMVGGAGALAAASAAGAYRVCAGQTGEAPNVPAAGASPAQLAPAYLDEMQVCAAADVPSADVLKRAGAGRINAKGDCEFPAVGVSCHYHTGVEFVTHDTSRQEPGVGELHCIFPSGNAKSPKVFGGHITCNKKGAGWVPQGAGGGGHVSHHVNEGAACSPTLLNQLLTCPRARCCDEGTLTNPIADLVKGSRNDIRPDFRICESDLVIDCDLLANLTPHDANSPALGGVRRPVFSATGNHHPTASAH